MRPLGYDFYSAKSANAQNASSPYFRYCASIVAKSAFADALSRALIHMDASFFAFSIAFLKNNNGWLRRLILKAHRKGANTQLVFAPMLGIRF